LPAEEKPLGMYSYSQEEGTFLRQALEHYRRSSN